jgi:hypothetical protein
MMSIMLSDRIERESPTTTTSITNYYFISVLFSNEISYVLHAVDVAVSCGLNVVYRI